MCSRRSLRAGNTLGQVRPSAEASCDVLVVGAGAAGLRAAIAAAHAGAHVIVADRNEPGRAGTTVAAASDWMAYSAAFGHADPRDSPEQHALDVILRGGLCLRPALAQKIAEDAPARLADLESYGARFDRAADGKYVQVHSDGAAYPRACGRGADTGPMMVAALKAECQRRGILMHGGLRLADLILDGARRTAGAVFSDRRGLATVISARAVVLATGGAGRVFRHHAYPGGMFGSGYAAALRVGARLANMEFLQIGPCIVHPVRFALSGIFWRLSPRVLNGRGEGFLATRVPAEVDLQEALHIKSYSFPYTVRNESFHVDIAIYQEITEGQAGPHGGVYMDLRSVPARELEQRAAVPLQHLLQRGVDIRTDQLEFAPSVQHCNGGVLIGEDAETDIPGLYAAGEVAGGQHGADRPGGNALADTQVFGRIAGAAAAEYARTSEAPGAAEAPCQPAPDPDAPAATERLRAMQDVMWLACTVIRNDSGLRAALERVEGLTAEPASGTQEEILDLRDALCVARAHLVSALGRTESRGTHFRSDYPRTLDPDCIRLQTVRCAGDAIQLGSERPEIEDYLLHLWQASTERRATPPAGWQEPHAPDWEQPGCRT